jgi:hypothetical protein
VSVLSVQDAGQDHNSHDFAGVGEDLDYSPQISEEAAASEAASNSVVYDQEEQGSHDGHQQAIQVQPIYTYQAEHVENPTTHNRPYDPKKNVEDHAFAAVTHNMAGDKTSE